MSELPRTNSPRPAYQHAAAPIGRHVANYLAPRFASVIRRCLDPAPAGRPR